MNITKIFGLILALHIGVILVLFVQPGCHSTNIEPPSQSDYQTSELSDELVSNSDLDSAFGENQIENVNDNLSLFNDLDEYSLPDEVMTVPVVDDSLDIHLIEPGDTLWDLAKKYDTTINALCKLNSISKDSILSIGYELKVPRVSDTNAMVSQETAKTYQPSNFEGTGKIYKVVYGDSLSKIANDFGVTIDSIRATNNIDGDKIYANQELLIPVKENDLSNEVIIPVDPEFVADSPNNITEDKAIIINSDLSEEDLLPSADQKTEVIAADPLISEEINPVELYDFDTFEEVEYSTTIEKSE